MPRQRTRIDNNVAISIEVGGTRATVALVDSHGEIIQRNQAKTLWGRPPLATLEPYLRAVDDMFAYAQAAQLRLHGVGISIPGTLDQSSRRPLLIPTLPALSKFPLCDLLETRYRLPARLHVDVDAALLGEYHFGAGRGFRRLLLLTVNAVVGAALASDGHIEPEQHGAEKFTGHICHIPVAASGPRCSCGRRGCINTLVTIDAIQRLVQRAVRRGETTSLVQRLSNREYFSHQLLAEEATRGDAVAIDIYNEVSRWLGAVTTKYIEMFEPDALLLGGGLLSAHEMLLARVRGIVTDVPPPRGQGTVEVLPARLGAEAALIGAATAFFAHPATPTTEELPALKSQNDFAAQNPL